MIGQRLGGYQVLSLLGAGAMGEVYRATDTRLGRDVAIKVLPASLAGDPDRVSRLAREAQLLASLNHPHIATIHGLQDADGVRALVMELVEGPTLSDRVVLESRGKAHAGLPLAAALTIAAEIAEALEAAHDKGIIHRDLKPANIKFSHDGHVKVLDFGLATARMVDAAGTAAASLPTIVATALHAGAVVGTPAYMSPEQARGQEIDKRSDIWAFGCVLFEMLSGRMAFSGTTVSDTVAAILEREPDWDALPSQTPDRIRQLLRRCLEKDSKRRLRDIGDARIEIRDTLSDPHRDRPAARTRSESRMGLTGTAVLVLLASIAGAIAMWAIRPVPRPSEIRLEITAPSAGDASLAVSPDGLKIVFVSTSGTHPQLWLRSVDSSSARPLPGTERASAPFWSPDSRSIAFFADSRLKRIDIDGGSPKTLAPAGVYLGGAWSPDGTILYSHNPGGPILRIPAGGGEPANITQLDLPRQRGHSFPALLPDGRHFLYFVTGAADVHGVYVGQIGGADTKRLLDADEPAVFASTGHIVFIRDKKLLAQAFNADRLTLGGEAFTVAEQVSTGAALSASAAGPIAYRTSTSGGRHRLSWIDRSGRELDNVIYDADAVPGLALSHDGRRIATYRFMNGNMDLWSYEIARHTWTRITFDAGDDIWPLWSPDDRRIVFAAVRKTDVVDLYRTLLAGAPESEEQLLATRQSKFPMDLSADGRFLLYDSLDPARGSDLWALPMEGDRKPFEVVRTDFSEGLGQFSPDGRWIAYESDKTGRNEVYLRAFPGAGGDTLASIDGGSQARWNPDGSELFYIAADDRLMAVPLRTAPDGKTMEPGTPQALFATTLGRRYVYRQRYVVLPKGQGFVTESTVEEGTASPITVILNWNPSR